jgi:hypothetical protein
VRDRPQAPSGNPQVDRTRRGMSLAYSHACRGDAEQDIGLAVDKADQVIVGCLSVIMPPHLAEL